MDMDITKWILDAVDGRSGHRHFNYGKSVGLLVVL